jgi:hypothetical protein
VSGFNELDLKRNLVSGCGLDSSGPRLGAVVGSCERDNNSSSFIKGVELFDLLGDC